MTRSQGELPPVSRELDLYDLDFLTSPWGGLLTQTAAAERLGISLASARRWRKDPGRYLPENPATTWPQPAEEFIYPVDSGQLTS